MVGKLTMVIIAVVLLLILAVLAAFQLAKENRKADIRARLEWSKDRLDYYDNLSRVEVHNHEHGQRMRSDMWYDQERWL